MPRSAARLRIWQTAKYFRRYPPGTDSLFNQICIIVALLGDIVSVIASLAAVYLFCITHWGDVAFVITSPWCVCHPRPLVRASGTKDL